MELRTVSVIVPVYNGESYLDRCIKSIMNQSWKRLEIILVDDGSVDGSPGLCDCYAETDSRIRVIHKKNGGLMSAWMTGVEASTGEYLCFVDCDDWVDLCMVEALAEMATGGPGEVICCNFVIERPDGTTQHRHELPPGIYEGRVLESEVKSHLLGNERRAVSMSRCMKLFSRELITDNMRYCNQRIRMGEDVNIVLPALCDCRRLVILKDALYYHYFYNPSSMVHRYDIRMEEGIRTLMDTIRIILQEKEPERWESQWETERVYLSMLVVKNELRGGRPGYAERTAAFCKGMELRQWLLSHRIPADEKACRILLWVTKRPGRFRCMAGKMMFGIYDWYTSLAVERRNR